MSSVDPIDRETVEYNRSSIQSRSNYGVSLGIDLVLFPPRGGAHVNTVSHRLRCLWEER